MNSRVKTTVLAISLITLLASPFADAARLGKGRSTGMQRTAPTQSYQQSIPPRAPAQAAPAQQQRGSGIGGMVAAGAAGAAAGYLLGNAMNDGKAGTGEQGGFPWLYVIGGALAGLALLSLFRRRAANSQPRPLPQTQQPMHYQPAGANGIPPIGSGSPQFGGSGLTPPPSSLQRLPDGTEVPHFLRQAKATFLHLQNLNSADSLEEVRKYLTPDLFQALQEDIAANTEPADFPQLDCQVVESTEESGRMICSVRFHGMVSESVGAAAVPFSETWHYLKDGNSNGKWLVAGIQQN
ncbi:Tim44 domain-containing protein [Vogesella oryzae]|uniref:Tim44 domain-containing protein n=1 Tax=Vogesella oryzae TaxID=1735285 RepID=UPI001581B8DB|nr:TIM44-like domain-containing protein [Vogesella oryzae]